jgi:pimeloyl-ACP methyl ester carboxylesterase
MSRADTIALSLPGFDSPLPQGFTATKEEYSSWLVAQLERQTTPVDLVGHDWGCILVARLASLRPDLIRTWAAGGGPVSASYEWHTNAQIWQTPGKGEEWMEHLDPKALAAALHAAGVPIELATHTVKRIDDRMKNCILRLYRSAIHVGAEWTAGLVM